MPRSQSVYVLVDPRDSTIRYVGITQNTNTRLNQHIKYSVTLEMQEWVNELKELGLKPDMQTIESELAHEEADKRETYWIKHHLALNASLFNVSKAKSTRLGYQERYAPYISDQWVTMREAANELKISYYKLTRLVAQGQIQTKEDVLDRRVRLVNLEEVKTVFRLV